MRTSWASALEISSIGSKTASRFSNPHGRSISSRHNHSSKRADRLVRTVCSSAMYYCCTFRCFTAASTSSSFCSVEQGSFWTVFSTCSDWNFASSCPSSCCACFDFGRSEILPWLPSFPERLLLQSMRVFRRLCRQIEFNFAAAREIVLPRGFGGAARLVIQGLFAPELSTLDRRLRTDFAFCWR